MYLESARGMESKRYKYKGFEITINHYDHNACGLESDYFKVQIERPGIYHEYENPRWIRRPINRFMGFDIRGENLNITWVLNQCKSEIDKIVDKEKGERNKIKMRVTEERLKNIFNDLVEELDLDHGNGGFVCLEDDGRFIGYIEAPNNTTLVIGIDVDSDFDEEMTDEEIREKFIDNIKEAIYDFDPEETFEEIWHPGFEISAFRFVEMLKEDEVFFWSLRDKL